MDTYKPCFQKLQCISLYGIPPSLFVIRNHLKGNEDIDIDMRGAYRLFFSFSHYNNKKLS